MDFHKKWITVILCQQLLCAIIINETTLYFFRKIRYNKKGLELMNLHKVKVKSILSAHNGMNIYRGCSHGCIYCDARSECYGMKHAFEDIEVKENAPELLESALKSKRRRCIIGTGGMSDPYLHIERELCLTRRCLEIIDRYNFGVTVQTKSDLILRDIELLDRINRKAKAVVQMTLTTADEKLCRIVEPNVCTTAKRLEVLHECRERKIPTVVWLCPLLPYINDTEENILSIINMTASAGSMGIINFGLGLTLRSGDREYYYSCLDKSFPGLKRKYIERYGNDYEIPSPIERRLQTVFETECKRLGLVINNDIIFEYLQNFEECEQLTLF